MASARRGREWLVALLVIAAAVAIVVAVRGRGSSAAPVVEAPPASSSAIPARFTHAPGLVLPYAFEWSSSTVMGIAGAGPQTNSVSIVGDIELVGAGSRGASTLVLARIRAIRTASVVALGRELVPDEAAANDLFLNRTAVIECDPRGVIAQIHVPKDAPALYKHLVHALLARTQVTLPGPGETTWIATEAGDNGPIVFRYGRSPDGVLRKEAEEPTVRARGEVRFDTTGAVASQEQTARFATGKSVGELGGIVAEARFARTLGATRVEAPPPLDLATYDGNAPGDRAAAIDERGQLEQLAQGMTLADVVTIVSAYGQGQRLPKGAVTRATGFLLLHPEATQDLLVLFQKDALGNRGRELIMDVLSSAGDDAAQAAMRAALSSRASMGDRVLFERLLASFSLVDDPRAETIVLIDEVMKRSKAAKESRVYYASIYTLGSLAGHAHEKHHDALAQPILDKLLKGLDAKLPIEEETAFLAALGNTGMAAALAPLKKRASAEDGRTRAQVATSLRQFDDAEVRAMLVAMLADGDPRTALNALSTLDKLSVRPDDMEQIAALVESGKTNVQADPQLVTFAASHAFARAAAMRILKVIEARATENQEILVRARREIAKLAVE